MSIHPITKSEVVPMKLLYKGEKYQSETIEDVVTQTIGISYVCMCTYVTVNIYMYMQYSKGNNENWRIKLDPSACRRPVLVCTIFDGGIQKIDHEFGVCCSTSHTTKDANKDISKVLAWKESDTRVIRKCLLWPHRHWSWQDVQHRLDPRDTIEIWVWQHLDMGEEFADEDYELYDVIWPLQLALFLILTW